MEEYLKEEDNNNQPEYPDDSYESSFNVSGLRTQREDPSKNDRYNSLLPDINRKGNVLKNANVSDDRKLNLIRKPRGSRRSNNSGHTLYTITSCSEEASTTTSQSSKMDNNTFTGDHENKEGSSPTEYQTDILSKPTNFATIQSSNQAMLPRISLNNGSRRTSAVENKRRFLKSRSSHFPDLEMKYLAKKNWINAEVKTFPLWHDLNKGKTVLRNSLPSLEMIQIEKMMEEMRHTKQTNPSALQFDEFAKRVKKENEERHFQHLMSNPRYNTMLEFGDY